MYYASRIYILVYILYLYYTHFINAKTGRAQVLRLPAKIGDVHLFAVHIVDYCTHDHAAGHNHGVHGS